MSKGLNFGQTLRRRASEIESWLCIGLDPALDRLPHDVPRTASGVLRFCQEIVASTSAWALTYKINFAFFEALGSEGWRTLERVRADIPASIPVIADAKRGDIASTGRAYASAILETLDFDAVTVNPYLGWDAIEPFVTNASKAAFVLCRTSNPGAREFQDLDVGGTPMFMHVARDLLSRKAAGEIGLVVGATYPDSLRAVRALSEDILLLMPGIGAQGAGARDAIRDGANRQGENALASVSREVIFASSRSDYAEAAGQAASRLAGETWHRDRAG